MTGIAGGTPRLCWIAPMMGPTGAVPDVFEKLAPALAARGLPGVCASSDPSSARRVREQVSLLRGAGRGTDATFVHVYGGRSFPIADLLTMVADRNDSPLIGYLSGGSIPDLAKQRPRWVRRVLGRFDLLSAPSPFMARMASDLGLEAVVTPNPVDLASFPYRRRTEVSPRMVWMRTFHSIYHPELAVEVLARVREELPGATLAMAGRDDGLLQATRERARSLGVLDALELPGFVDPVARNALLDRSDIFLHTNRIDNTPVSLLEAAATGLPIVATAVGGVPDLFSDETDALLAPPDADELAARVVRLVRDPAVALRLADAALERTRSVSLDEVVDRWVAHLAALGVVPAANYS